MIYVPQPRFGLQLVVLGTISISTYEGRFRSHPLHIRGAYRLNVLKGRIEDGRLSGPYLRTFLIP